MPIMTAAYFNLKQEAANQWKALISSIFQFVEVERIPRYSRIRAEFRVIKQYIKYLKNSVVSYYVNHSLIICYSVHSLIANICATLFYIGLYYSIDVYSL